MRCIDLRSRRGACLVAAGLLLMLAANVSNAADEPLVIAKQGNF
jgi:hypothetical protein